MTFDVMETIERNSDSIDKLTSLDEQDEYENR